MPGVATGTMLAYPLQRLSAITKKNAVPNARTWALTERSKL